MQKKEMFPPYFHNKCSDQFKLLRVVLYLTDAICNICIIHKEYKIYNVGKCIIIQANENQVQLKQTDNKTYKKKKVFLLENQRV